MYRPLGPASERRRQVERARAEAEARSAWRWYLKEGATDEWVAERYRHLGKPWANPRLTPAEARRVRMREDAAFAAQERVRARIKKLRRCGRLSWAMRRALNTGGRSNVLERDLGYTADDLRRRLEAQFTEGMTWDAFAEGRIHIDHIVPTTQFDLSTVEGVRACWALSNLQPLWAEDNLRKGARLDWQPAADQCATARRSQGREALGVGGAPWGGPLGLGCSSAATLWQGPHAPSICG